MLASKPVPAGIAEPRLLPFSRVMLPAAAAAIGTIGALYIGNPRLLASWHGFLHTAIATRFSQAAFPPENPFFAGEPLPYYWVYHFVAYWISRLAQLDLLHTFQAISWISLAAFVVMSGLIGRAVFRSNIAGVAIAFLGLAGVNPLGPAVAATKHFTRGVPLVQRSHMPVETVFVSTETSDGLMAQPLLGAMYVGGDWRPGQNLVWFFDVGSRAPALAGLMLLLFLLLAPGVGWVRYASVAIVSALLTAFNPLVGLAATGTLAGASVLLRSSRRSIGLTLVALAGAIAAAPTYWHIFFRAGGSKATLHQMLALPPAIVAANFLILLPLALLGVRRGDRRLAAVAISAVVLLLVTIAVRLPEGNEHNLSNAAQCLLAIPAAAAVTNKRILCGLLLVFTPVTACTLFAFAARPPMPIATTGTTLLRTPATGDLEPFYQWIRSGTPAQAIFIVDPQSPVKMSGNVSELPAFTGRTLFTDTPNYLTTPNADAPLRSQLAVQAAAGRPLTTAQREYVLRFGRPVYIVSYRDEGVPALTELYGPPAFRRGFVAAFRFSGGPNAL
jgi:hypothetical protein